MEQKNIKTFKIKSYNFFSTPSKKNKIIFNSTINIPDNNKTSKNINKSLNSFSFRSQKKNIINKTLNVNNIESMNKILGRITNLNNKLNQIKNRRKRNLKLLKSDISKPKIMFKTESKNKYLLYMNDYYKNKLLLKKRKLENALSEEERNDNYNKFLNPDFLSFEKNEINHNEPSKHTKLTKIISIENYFESKKEENKEKGGKEENNSTNKNKNHENSRNSRNSIHKSINLDIEKKLSHKNSFISEDIFIPQIISPKKNEDNKKEQKEQKEQNIQNNNNDLSNSFLIYQDHINYIKRIKENELLDLINRYKKSLQKNQLEEMSHIQRFVFPQELITYLIKMKKELIVDKFRTEYFNKLDRYNLNNILHLKAAKNKNITSRKFK